MDYLDHVTFSTAHVENLSNNPSQAKLRNDFQSLTAYSPPTGDSARVQITLFFKEPLAHCCSSDDKIFP